MRVDPFISDGDLPQRIKEVTKKLRGAYYLHHYEEIIRDVKALGGGPKESIGPWPEFNLRGKWCRRSL